MVNKFTSAEQLWSTRLNQKGDTFKSIDLKFAVDQIYSAVFKNDIFFKISYISWKKSHLY